MNIIFHTNQLCLRGTTLAIYNYAKENENILKNVSHVAYQTNPNHSNENMVKFFNEKFPSRVVGYKDFNELYDYAGKNNIDMIYYIKGGWNDGKVLNGYKNVIHSVFNHYEPHGEIYSYLSDWLRDEASKKNAKAKDCPIVYPIIDMQISNENLRGDYNIPEDAIVFGRHGGQPTFDVPYVYNAIKDLLDKRLDVYFVFLNTAVFLKHDRVIYIPPMQTQDEIFKSKFLNTCDAMIHARKDGETFSTAIGEFLLHNKPIITNTDCVDREHIVYRLKEHGIYYDNYQSAFDQLNNFKPKQNDFNYRSLIEPFNKNNAMSLFKKIYIDEDF